MRQEMYWEIYWSICHDSDSGAIEVRAGEIDDERAGGARAEYRR
jgi:hypothetical protein